MTSKELLAIKLPPEVWSLVQMGLYHARYYQGSFKGLPGEKTLEALDEYLIARAPRDHTLIDRLVTLAEGEVGTLEKPSNSGPRIIEYQRATWLGGTGWPYCLTGEVEVLTKNGWVALRDYKSGDVAQVTPKGVVEFVTPSNYIQKEYAGELVSIKTRGLDVVTSPEHEWWAIWNGMKRPEVRTIGTSKLFSLPAVYHYGPGCGLSFRDLDFLAAFLSDGFFHKGFVEFGVSRERKIEALSGFTYRTRRTDKRTYGDLQKVPKTYFTFEVPWWFSSVISGDKDVSMDFLLSMTMAEKRHFADQMMWWDGAQKRNVLTAKRRQHIDAVALCVALSGEIPTVRMFASTSKLSKGNLLWSVQWGKQARKRARTIAADKITRFEGQETLYCLTVPSGVFLARDKNGNIFPTGNCAGFVCWLIREAIKGQTVKFERPRTAAAWDFENWAREQKGKGVELLTSGTIRRGDLVVFKISHIGIAVRDENLSTGRVETVEANTGPDGGRDGDGVWRKSRRKSEFRSWIRFTA